MSRSRYEVLLKIASGGMGTVHVARMHGGLGFQQLVAVKRPHAYVVEDPKIRDMLVREAHVASSIRHANVVTMRDVEVEGEAVLLVMDYVEGGALSELVIPDEGIPPPVAVRIALDALGGLHAAHEATDQAGVPLGVVHRDVSPHNILVGTDGVARVADFGIAKCMAEKGDASTTGSVKGKLAYMAPEYVQGGVADVRVDLFAIGIVLWESLTGKRLFRGSNDAETLDRLLRHDAAPLTQVGPKLNAVIARALAKNPDDRFATADELVEALDRAARAEKLTATHREVGGFVRWRLREKLEERRTKLKALLAGADESEAAAPAVAASTMPEIVTEELLRKHGTARVPIVTAPLDLAPLSVTRPLASTLRLEEPWSPPRAAAGSSPDVSPDVDDEAEAARASVTPEPMDEVPPSPPLSGSRATLVAVIAAAGLALAGSGWAIKRAMTAPAVAVSAPDREARVEGAAPSAAPSATVSETTSATTSATGAASHATPVGTSAVSSIIPSTGSVRAPLAAPSSAAASRPRSLQAGAPRPLPAPSSAPAPLARPAVTELPPDPPRRRNPYE